MELSIRDLNNLIELGTIGHVYNNSDYGEAFHYYLLNWRPGYNGVVSDRERVIRYLALGLRKLQEMVAFGHDYTHFLKAMKSLTDTIEVHDQEVQRHMNAFNVYRDFVLECQ